MPPLCRNSVFACAAFLILALRAPAAVADDVAHRWGAGWDRGLAVRYRLNDVTGVGLRVNPNFFDADLHANDSVTAQDTGREDWNLDLGLLVFREQPIGDWVRVGPYGELGFSYQEGDWSVQGTAGYTRQTAIERAVSLEAGIRPVFAIESRFCLEARLGLTVSRVWSSRWVRATGTVSGDMSVSTTGTSWRFSALGENLGFGSLLSFTIYL